MHLIAVEGVEPRSHSTQRNSIQCQAGEVVGDRDRGIGALSSPLHYQLSRDIVHVYANHQYLIGNFEASLPGISHHRTFRGLLMAQMRGLGLGAQHPSWYLRQGHRL